MQKVLVVLQTEKQDKPSLQISNGEPQNSPEGDTFNIIIDGCQKSHSKATNQIESSSQSHILLAKPNVSSYAKKTIFSTIISKTLLITYTHSYVGFMLVYQTMIIP